MLGFSQPSQSTQDNTEMYVNCKNNKKINTTKHFFIYICFNYKKKMTEYSYLSDELDGYVEEDVSTYGTITSYFDGACYPYNPDGNMGWGFHIGKKIAMCGFEKKKKGNTNNVAEYLALYYLLLHLSEYSGKTINIKGDSKLVIMQMKGAWKIKEGSYVPIAYKTLNILKEVKKNNTVNLKWIPREENKVADRLSNLISKI